MACGVVGEASLATAVARWLFKTGSESSSLEGSERQARTRARFLQVPLDAAALSLPNCAWGSAAAQAS
jgi:hypothetical protein